MKPETQRVMELVQTIRDIENEIESLNEQRRHCEQQLDQLIISRSSVVNISTPQTDSPRRGRAASEASARSRIARLLNEHVAIDFDADTVAKELNIPIGTVRSNLSRLKGDGAIEKRASNKYGAVTPK